ncbi:C-type lectin domain family 6 member A-like [Leucoraja erinacea]|uniref:C-type lectin domain family 6 member A-like n=1 Tax=Leucoraja erinaceus TaxID=7782 RepID=UPI0024543E11|nr:C-type lectin domain family 6 member A-like [Leucoraja erinacea]
MEQINYYATIADVSANKHNRDGTGQTTGGVLHLHFADRGMKAEDRSRHKLSAPVVYSLLGLSIVLSAAALCVAVILNGAVNKTQLGLKSHEQVIENIEMTIAQFYKLLTDIPRLSVHSCPEQWTKFNQSCYHFSSTSATWEEAQRFCASADAHLVVINNAEEQLCTVASPTQQTTLTSNAYESNYSQSLVLFRQNMDTKKK